jgi:hypothetical protein
VVYHTGPFPNLVSSVTNNPLIMDGADNSFEELSTAIENFDPEYSMYIGRGATQPFTIVCQSFDGSMRFVVGGATLAHALRNAAKAIENGELYQQQHPSVSVH